MKIVRLSSVLMAAAMMLPAVASAQSTIHFDAVKTAGGDQVNSAATGAYQVHQTLPTLGSTFDIYCIDYDHHMQTDWGVTYLTFAQATGGGANGAAANRQLGTEKVWGLAELRAAAWLSTQFGPAGIGGAVGAGAGDDLWDDVHGAIWSMFSTSVPVTAAMTSIATNAVTAHGAETFWDNNYLVGIDTRAFNSDISTSVLSQSFLVNDDDVTVTVVTPEPSTYALMGAGLLVVGFIRRRRRSV